MSSLQSRVFYIIATEAPYNYTCSTSGPAPAVCKVQAPWVHQVLRTPFPLVRNVTQIQFMTVTLLEASCSLQRVLNLASTLGGHLLAGCLVGAKLLNCCFWLEIWFRYQLLKICWLEFGNSTPHLIIILGGVNFSRKNSGHPLWRKPNADVQFPSPGANVLAMGRRWGSAHKSKINVPVF
jgi:hypothetical protein